jgi:hypothetical protein
MGEKTFGGVIVEDLDRLEDVAGADKGTSNTWHTTSYSLVASLPRSIEAA